VLPLSKQTSFGAGGELVEFKIRATVSEETIRNIELVNRLLLDWLTFTSRLNLPKNVQKQLTTIQQLVLLLNTLRTTWALTASTTPLGVIMTVPTAFGLGYSFVDAIGSFG